MGTSIHLFLRPDCRCDETNCLSYAAVTFSRDGLYPPTTQSTRLFSRLAFVLYFQSSEKSHLPPANLHVPCQKHPRISSLPTLCSIELFKSIISEYLSLSTFCFQRLNLQVSYPSLFFKIVSEFHLLTFQNNHM